MQVEVSRVAESIGFLRLQVEATIAGAELDPGELSVMQQLREALNL